MKRELKETNNLLRDEVSTTKAILSQHIIEYNETKGKNEKKFDKIFAVLRSREGVYQTAKWIKWGVGILMAGALTAAGASLWNNYAIEEKPKAQSSPTSPTSQIDAS